VKSSPRGGIGRLVLFIVSLGLLLPLPLYLLSKPDNQANADLSEQNLSPAIQPAVLASDSTATSNDIQQGNNPTIRLQTALTQLPQTTLDATFNISIPSIGLSHDIYPNVDPTQRDVYLPILEQFVAHGNHTSVPSAPFGNTYLFAHSKNWYNGITPPGGWFTRIDELKAGDPISVNYHGQVYNYIVVTSFIVNPENVSVYTPTTLYPDHRSLTLQTCYPRGDTSKRLIVQAIGE